MILYTLACDEGHRFDSWFRDSTAYDEQASRGLVTCPTCRSARVAKTIMAPAVVGARKVEASASETPREAASPAPAEDAASRSPMDVTLLDPRRRELAALLKSVREKVIAEGHDVGLRFPEEARRIHDGDAPARQIYGQASLAEAHDLLDEGILVLPLPTSPEDFN